MAGLSPRFSSCDSDGFSAADVDGRTLSEVHSAAAAEEEGDRMNRSNHGQSIDGSNHGRNARSTDRVPSVDILSPHAHATTDGVHVGKIGGDEGDEFLRKSLNPAAVAEGRESDSDASVTPEQAAARDRMLGISFLAMVFIGSMNKIFNKLETGPM